MGGLRRARCWMVAMTLVAMVVAAPVSARAEGLASNAGVGLGTALLNLLYIPAKITYATLGAVTGGFAYALTVGSVDTAMQVWQPTMGGTYVLSPEMLRGEEAVRFSGGSSTQDDTSSQG